RARADRLVLREGCGNCGRGKFGSGNGGLLLNLSRCRGLRLLVPLVFRNRFPGQNDRLVSGRWAVFRSRLRARRTFGAFWSGGGPRFWPSEPGLGNIATT